MKLHPDATHWKTLRRFETLEEDFRKVHGDKYDYSKVIYKGNRDKIIIGCPVHGWFEQTPDAHANGCGCNDCASDKMSLERSMSPDEYIIKAKLKHDNYYEYKLPNPFHTKILIKILCPIHGWFEQEAGSHLYSGNGCVKCANINRHLNQKSNTEEFILKAIGVHGDRYDYSKVNYINCKTPVDIICPHHGVQPQTPNNHLRGYGCLECSKVNFIHQHNPEIPCNFYVIKYKNLYKIGITKHSIEERYRQEVDDINNIEILEFKRFKRAKEALDLEKYLKLKYNSKLYKGKPIFKHTFNSEVFTEDIYGTYLREGGIINE